MSDTDNGDRLAVADLSAGTQAIPGTYTAPIIYFDSISGSGIVAQGAVIQVELAANILLGHTGSDARQMAVGHLRCSQLAARSLVSVLNNLLATFEKPEGPAN